MIDEAAATRFDLNSDPSWLARIGAHGAERLVADPRLQQIDLAEPQVHVSQNFLSTEERKGLIVESECCAMSCLAQQLVCADQLSLQCRLDGQVQALDA